MAKDNNTKFIIKLSVILFAITFTATLLLTLCNYITKDRIALLQEKKAQEAKQAVIADASFEEIKIDESILKEISSIYDVKAYSATKGDEFAGYCFDVTTNGYIGPINLMVGIDSDMNYSGIKIISMSETPGLGAKTSEEDFYGQFANGKSGTLRVVKNNPNSGKDEINAVSGATISSKAITNAANSALEIAKILQEKEAK